MANWPNAGYTAVGPSEAGGRAATSENLRGWQKSLLATTMTSSMCNQPWYATFLLRSAVLPQAFLQKSLDSQNNT